MTRDPRIVAIGEVFEGRARHVTLARALALSGGPFDAPDWPERNLHTDLRAANEAGLAAVVVSGTQWEGYLVGFLAELFGPAWFGRGELDVRITRSVKVGESVRPLAVLAARAPVPEGLRIELEVRCENGDGQPVLAGTAACTLPRTAG